MRLLFSVLFLVFCLIATGCGKKYPIVPGQSEVQGHVINIGKGGEYRPLPNTGMEKLLETQQLFDLIFRGIDTFLKEENNSCQHPSVNKNILIYVHGGLNSYENAMKRVVAGTKEMKCAGTYPVFINWRSGPFTTLGDHYFRIRDGEVSKTARLTSPIYLVGDLAKTIGNIPMAWYHEGYQVTKTTFLDNDEQDLEDDLQRQVVSLTKDNKDRWNFWRRTVWVVTAPVKLISTPFVFTFGTPAWDNMKRRTHTMFTTEDDFQQPALPAPAIVPSGVALRFLKQLNNYIRQVKKKYPELELTIMGHSMGGIIINRAFRDLPDLEVDNIVYMASADNLQNYLDATLPLIKNGKAQGKDLQVYNLHLHPENENREISFYGLVPSGSLLTWIDHTYDTPEYILQRTSGRWSNIRQVINFIPQEYRASYHFKVFGRGSTKKSPQTHGSFDETRFKFWQKSYWTGTQVN